ncbi:hypothetical protein GGI15_003208 [Coemansia interrupta]|uniref:Phospholipase D/nuclease n=1 Tax=Coemansia interrupta TaxID=1126814 RepID=A0A9W8H8L9_9FUNG|nr:hypothetical protein GGI15_003208 [Coemansia interrupta]
MFSRGAVRRTKMQGVKSLASDTISFSGVIEAKSGETIEHALVTGFYIDEHWLLSHLSSANTRITLVAEHRLNEQLGDSRVTRITPPKPKASVQIMHSKLMILYFASHMRFVVSTASMTPYGWSVVQNAVFIQDFPRAKGRVYTANSFSLALAYALHDLSVPHELIGLLNEVKFADARAHIVTTVPSGAGGNMEEYGAERLARVLKEAGADPENQGLDDIDEFRPNGRLYCVGSSLGPLDDKWLRDMYVCAHGLSPLKLGWPGVKTLPNSLVDIGVAFHTQQQVEQCRYGSEVGEQHIYAQRKAYEDKKFPHSAMVRLEPVVDKTLVHAKVILARMGESQRAGWMYIGSHNFTPAAWGRMNSKSYYSNNYEFGVVLCNVEYSSDSSSVRWDGREVPLPFKLTWEPYGRSDTPYLK